jgi:hypothetical protein
MSLRRNAGICLAGVVAAAGLAAIPTAAQAAVPGLVRVSVASVSNSVDKSSTATCPAGKTIVGVGAELNGAGGQVIIDEVVPNAALTSATTWAYEDASGFTGSWSITTYVNCANPVAGLTRVLTTSASSSAAKSVTATCPAGRNVLGGSFQVNNGLGDVVTTNVNPNVGLTSVTVTAYEAGVGTAASWTVAAIAICANPLPGLMRSEGSSLSDTALYKSVTTTCQPGYVATGGGFFVGGSGQVIPDDIRLSPTATTHFFGAYEDDTGYTGSTYVQSRAVCAIA